jgi:hypothetical protein
MVVGKRLIKEKMVPFKVRFHAAEAIRDYLTWGTKKASSHREDLPRELSVGGDLVESTQSKSTEVAAETPTEVLLQNISVEMANFSVEMANKGVPLVDLEPDEGEARNQKATKADDAKVPVYLWDGRVAKIRAQ